MVFKFRHFRAHPLLSELTAEANSLKYMCREIKLPRLVRLGQLRALWHGSVFVFVLAVSVFSALEPALSVLARMSVARDMRPDTYRMPLLEKKCIPRYSGVLTA